MKHFSEILSIPLEHNGERLVIGSVTLPPGYIDPETLVNLKFDYKTDQRDLLIAWYVEYVLEAFEDVELLEFIADMEAPSNAGSVTESTQSSACSPP
jgi:hypothetical protein